MITLADIQAAQERITGYVRRTPTVYNESVSKLLGTNVYLKQELFQKTGSFKPRGAFNKLLGENPQGGVIAVSGGNHAQAVAYAGTALGLRTRICMPEYTPRNYLEATRGYGAEIELLPDIAMAFAAAEEYARQGWTYVHPYDDPAVMAGGGTIALEVFEDVPNLTDIFVSVGGGGMMAGVTVAVKALKPDARVWSVETDGADALARALEAGKPVRFLPTSLARTLGGPIAAEDALKLAQTKIEQHIVVSDEEAYHTQRFLLERAKLMTELASSCTLAAAERVKGRFSPDDHVVLVICGGNVSLDDLVDYHKRFEKPSA